METLLLIINYIGIVSFAAAGAMIAIDHETDLFGVVLLSLLTCFGGGMLRDVIAGQSIGREIPAFFTDMTVEILLCLITAVVAFVIAAAFKRKYVEKEAAVDRINNILDALGIGVFAAAGTGAYLDVNPLVAIVMGLLSSIGGSIIRDIMLNTVPFVLTKRVYAVAILIGSSAYYLIAKVLMAGAESADVVATVACIVIIFTIRMCATLFKWNMPKAIRFSELRSEENDNDMVMK
jgi:uncharacterized membrane protein YeiH